MSDRPKTSDPMVAALLREREGLVQRGLDDRVTQVDVQLAARGYVTADGSASTAGPTVPEERIDSRAEAQVPRARQTKPRTTTERKEGA